MRTVIHLMYKVHPTDELKCERNSCLWFLFDNLDDREVNHWLLSNQTSTRLIETFNLFQLVGVNPVMHLYQYYTHICN